MAHISQGTRTAGGEANSIDVPQRNRKEKTTGAALRKREQVAANSRVRDCQNQPRQTVSKTHSNESNECHDVTKLLRFPCGRFTGEKGLQTRRVDRCSRVINRRGNSKEESRERTHVCALTGWRSRDRNDSGESGRPSGKYIGPCRVVVDPRRKEAAARQRIPRRLCARTRAATHVFTHGARPVTMHVQQPVHGGASPGNDWKKKEFLRPRSRVPPFFSLRHLARPFSFFSFLLFRFSSFGVLLIFS